MKSKALKNQGFAALTLVIFVTSNLFIFVTSNAIEASQFFDQALRKEYRAINFYNAESCIDQAILELAHDYFFLTNTPLEKKDFLCSILSVASEGDIRKIVARGDYMKAYVYRSAEVRMHPQNLEILKIE
jgi:hypothetical protein